MRSMPRDVEEDRAIEACLRGNVDEFSHLFDKYRERVFFLALSVVKDASLARDVTQGSFIRIFRSLEWFDRRSRFSTWVYRITYNQALDQYRRRRKRGEREVGGIETPPSFSSPKRALFDGIANNELRSRLWAAMEALPLKLRTAVVLRYIEGLTYSEICRVMGCARGVLQRRLLIASKKLKDMLKTEIGELRE